jgi:hypothetical protein
MSLDLIALAETLTPEEFERLLRIRLQMAFNRLDQYSPSIVLIATKPPRQAPHDISATWKVGHYGKAETRGEILDAVVEEHLRRSTFEETCLLHKQIEGTVE